MKVTRYITLDLIIKTNFSCEELARAFDNDDTFVGQDDTFSFFFMVKRSII